MKNERESDCCYCEEVEVSSSSTSFLVFFKVRHGSSEKAFVPRRAASLSSGPGLTKPSKLLKVVGPLGLSRVCLSRVQYKRIFMLFVEWVGVTADN